jgi:hypothetical protein
MRELPSGTVTLLFTDIEGSTRLLHELGDAYVQTLAEHRRLLRDAFARHGGVEVDTQGDAFLAAFGDARAAVDAAADAQRALGDGPIRVRMGLHTGKPTPTGEGYVGLDVHIGARICAAGHGGQTLLSAATRGQIDGEVADLGEHRLKDLAEPVWLYQLGDRPFPPLRTIANTNLPRPASSFVGRGREVVEVLALIRGGARVVTLIGPGGSGKTRLALEAASEFVGEYPNGVIWVPLAALSDSRLILETIGQTLGAHGDIAAYLAERRLLLLLDNFGARLVACERPRAGSATGCRARSVLGCVEPPRGHALVRFAARECQHRSARAARAGVAGIRRCSEPSWTRRNRGAAVRGKPRGLPRARR